jgi:hypothetical protein
METTLVSSTVGGDGPLLKEQNLHVNRQELFYIIMGYQQFKELQNSSYGIRIK